MSATETHVFKSEARELLDLMIHSLYSHKEIFLRELISNASDALDKLRYETLTDEALKGALATGNEGEIRLEVDKDARTLTLHDNGIGMTRAEVIQNLGTIARSGTREFAQRLKEAREGTPDGNETAALIGQFGVGFYSAFMAADRVEVVTRRAGTAADAPATRWTSTGDGTFTVGDAERETHGTSVTLHLRPADAENGLPDFTQDYEIRRVVKKYSDFVTWPIRLGDSTLNSQKAIWTRSQGDVTAEEYAEFYKHVAHDWEAPYETLTLKAEGTFEYQALLFIPSRPPFDLYYREQKFGLQLYVNRVLIMERCEELLPDYLRFVKGVVDSPDLSLNVSREILQNDRRVGQIRKRVVKKVLDTLEKIKTEDRTRYAKFWDTFGKVLKEGLAMDPDNADKLKDLLWFQSSADATAPTSLKEYVGRIKEESGQDAIYYATGESRAVLEKSPHLEAFLAKGYEVLFLTDPVDELLVDHLTEYEGKKLQSVGKGEVELGTETEKLAAEEARKAKQTENATLLSRIQAVLDADVKEVRVSSRLTTSAACLVGDEEDMSPRLERLLKATQGVSELPRQKRILEVNADHAILARMRARFEADADDPVLTDFARLLHGQALLAEGSPLPDPAGFAQLVTALMVRAG
ncbi:molecular chaperone HtpG [Myxococcota bacterium]|nr:molecular chaperone HtpG [Myxococcota bacterium]